MNYSNRDQIEKINISNRDQIEKINILFGIEKQSITLEPPPPPHTHTLWDRMGKNEQIQLNMLEMYMLKTNSLCEV